MSYSMAGIFFLPRASRRLFEFENLKEMTDDRGRNQNQNKQDTNFPLDIGAKIS